MRLCLCLCVYVDTGAVAWGGQAGPLDPLELGLQALSCLTWVLGSKLHSSEFHRWTWAISPTPTSFFLMVKTLWSILQTPYISQNKTQGDSQYILLLFTFRYLFLAFTFYKLYSWRTACIYAMKYDHTPPFPPPTSLQPHHHASPPLPTSYALSKAFSVDHMCMGVRQPPGARETPPIRMISFPPPAAVNHQ